MNKKIVCVIANGYAEEMMAAALMDNVREELSKLGKADDYMFVGGSLVSSGRWYQDKRFATFFSGGVSPSGGFPTRSWSGFFSDLFAGVFKGPFLLSRFISQWADNGLHHLIVVGDFLLLSTAFSALKKSYASCTFIPTAKSDYIQSHFKIEKRYIKKYANISFPRDEITTQDFQKYGINAECAGNLMQDLLSPEALPLSSKDPIVALLPGSREESYGNTRLILKLIQKIIQPVQWALVRAASLDPQKLDDIFIEQGFTILNETAQNAEKSWLKDRCIIHVYPSTFFDSVALGCVFGISLAGTVGDQIAGLGKPILSFVGTGPQSSKSRMIEYEKLLGEAFIYGHHYPNRVVDTINRLLSDDQWRQKIGAEGLRRMGHRGATARIAKRIVQLYF